MNLFAKIVCSLFAIGMMSFASHSLYLGIVSRGWPSIEGAIESSNVQLKLKGGSKTYRPAITYSYRVNGVEYSGKRISNADYGSGWQGPAQAAVKRCREGDTIRVYHDPADPKNALLEPGISWSTWVLVGIGLLLTACSVILFRRKDLQTS